MMTKTTVWQKITLVILGVVLSIGLIEMGMRLTGLVISGTRYVANKQALLKSGAYTVLCLGESTTFLGSIEHSYPKELERMLNKNRQGLNFRVVNQGVIGVESEGILEDLKDNLNEFKPHIVVTMIGINDERNEEFNKIVPFQSESGLHAFFQKFKTFKLIRHIWLHARLKNKKSTQEFDFSEYGEPLAGYLNKAYMHLDVLEFDDAKEILDQAMKADPNNSKVHSGLGAIYSYEAKMELAVQHLEKAIELDPKNEEAYNLLFSRYFYSMDYERAVATIQNMLTEIPRSDDGYEKLALLYFKQKDWANLEKTLIKADELFPQTYIFTKLWAGYLLERGQTDQAEEKFMAASRMEGQLLSPMTVSNYRQIRDIILDRGIKMVSVQYPLRDVSHLKYILESHQDVVFVDNETNFKQALEHGTYDHYFVDNFAGDFGHLSTEGNKLLAKNIAQAILTHYFGAEHEH